MGIPRESQERCRRLTMILLILATFASPLLAQESVFAPFISRLRISINDPQVRITWVDAPDIPGPYAVYRSTEPITNETLNTATRVGDAAAGDEAYLDVPDIPGDYYYAVLALTEAGNPYSILIPGRNSSFRPVAVVNLATPREEAATIREIDARFSVVDGENTIAITARANRDARELLVYRATRQIETIDNLDVASLVTTVESDQIAVLDLPVPGVGYFYAILDRELLLDGGAEIVPGENATTVAAEIPIIIAGTPDEAPPTAEAVELEVPAEAESPAIDAIPVEEPEVEFEVVVSEQDVRAIPLPFLQLQTVLSTGRRLRDLGVLIPDRTTLSAEADETVSSLLSSLSPTSETAPTTTILDADQGPSPAGADFTLRTIIDGPIERLAWEEALQQLTNFLSLPLTPELAARAHFYRGQAYYYSGDRQLAVLEFLLARDEYFVEVEEWLTLLLTAPRT